MFEQMNEQIKNAMKPMTELATLNMSTMQELAEKNNAVYSSMLSEGMSYFEKASQQKDLMSLAETQKSYMETLQTSMTDAAKSNYSILSEAQQKASELMKGFTSEVTASAKK